MAKNLTTTTKQYLAKILYTREQLDGKVVAQKVGISEKTMSEWVKKFAWKNLRNRMLLAKDAQISALYEELEEITTAIQSKEAGQRYADTKIADIRVKTTAAIRNLETDLAIADLVESGIRFVKFLQKVDTAQNVVDIADKWHSFIQASIK